MPSLQDSYFSGSLILVCEHNAEGALGLIVNKPTQTNLEELLAELELDEPTQLDASEIAVLEGGPVAPERGFILHTGAYTTDNSLEVCPGLHLALLVVSSVDVQRRSTSDRPQPQPISGRSQRRG